MTNRYIKNDVAGTNYLISQHGLKIQESVTNSIFHKMEKHSPRNNQ